MKKIKKQKILLLIISFTIIILGICMIKKTSKFVLVKEANNVKIKNEQSTENAQELQNSQNQYEISSFEDLKKYLEYVDIDENFKLNKIEKILLLKEGNYILTNDFEIDLNDPYFEDKKQNIKYGIIYSNKSFTLNGNDKTISIKQDEAYSLFGAINSEKYEIKNLNINYSKDVLGFTFANDIRSKDINKGLAIADGSIKNVSIKVNGDVKPLRYISQKQSKYFLGNYRGYISSGFAWFIENTNIENLKINVEGNIGTNKRPDKPSDMVSSFGVAFHYSNVPYTGTYNYNIETWNELHDNGNAEILKEAGHIINLDLNVGKNIQAYGYNAGYAAGIGNSMSDAWMDNINVKIGNDIIVDLIGNDIRMYADYSRPYACGISYEVMNLTNSKIELNNIILNSKEQPATTDAIYICGIAVMNSRGNYINIRKNDVKVNGKIKTNTDTKVLSSLGFGNIWTSSGRRGVNFLQYNQENTYNVGGIELVSDGMLEFYALGQKMRTGQDPLGSIKLPEASLNNNKVNVGDVKISSKNNYAIVSLMMGNASNAKNNTMNYGDVNIDSKNIYFSGIGDLKNAYPATNFYENIASDNYLFIKNLNIKSEDAPVISLMAGIQDKDQKLENCVTKVENVNIDINSNTQSFIAGIASYSFSQIDGCRVNVDNININNKSETSLYFGLGAAYKNGTIIKKSAAFVDSNLKITSKKTYAGGFIGYIKDATVENCNIQIDGKNEINYEDGLDAGFAGWIINSNIIKCTSLMLNDFINFASYASGGSIQSSAHYINGKAPKNYSAFILASEEGFNIENSTLILEKEFQDTILYKKTAMPKENAKNYVVVVDIDNKYNRVAYEIEEVTAKPEEMNREVKVFKKSNKVIGKINIKLRSFQDKYWNSEVSKYNIGEQEKDFIYMNSNENAGNITTIGIDKDKIAAEGPSKVQLKDYYNRHLGLISDQGVIYDLLGIKGSLFLNINYDGNGNTSGKAPEDKTNYKFATEAIVKGQEELKKDGYKFIEWNTKKDGTGESYLENSKIVMDKDITLYAIWKKEIIPLVPAPILEVEDKTIYVGDELDLNSLIKKAETNENKDAKAEVKILDDGGFTNKKDGVYKVKYTLKDKIGASVTKTATVIVLPKPVTPLIPAPILEVEDKTIYVGDALDLNSLIKKAQTNENKDAKAEVKILDDGGFTNKKDGVYKVKYTLKDKIGASVTKTATVIVLPKPVTPLVPAPILEVEDKTIYVGDELDLNSLIKKAQTNENKDAKAEVKILDRGGFNNKIIGIYQVKFILKDKIGANVTKTAIVKVLENVLVPEIPEIPQIPDESKIPQTPNEIKENGGIETDKFINTPKTGGLELKKQVEIFLIASISLAYLCSKKQNKKRRKF